jgi:hypothetical protein
VTHLAAVLALNVVHVGRFGALLGHVTIFATVATAAATLLQRLLTIASTVTDLVAVDTLLDDLVLRFTLLLLTLGPGVAYLVAVAADDDEAVHRKASLTETVDVLLWTRRPTSGEDGTPRFSRPLDGDGVLLVCLALQVDQGPVDSDFLLLSDQVSVELLAAESLLQVLESRGANRLGVGEKGLGV